MAKNALLIWSAASAVVCGSAALATTSLWRVPAEPSLQAAVAPSTSVVLYLPFPEAPSALAGLDPADLAPVGAFLPVSNLSLFSPTADGASNLFRPTLGVTADSPASGGPLPPARPDLAEIVTENAASHDPRLAVLPPPRPSFQLARLDGSAGASIAVLQPTQPAPGFESPAALTSSPTWNWADAFRAPQQPTGPERVLNAGVASWYGPGFHGRKTASGERFDQNDLTAAHRTLPFGTRVKVVDERTGRSVVVRINDRGPFKHGRVIDLSKAAAQTLGVGGLSRVKVVSAN
jgi:rare lipoprotein A